MRSLSRTLRLVLVNKYSVYIFPILSIASTICLLYCSYSSGFWNGSETINNISKTENRRTISDVTKVKDIKRWECYLFLLILSSPKGFTQRQAMRETWLKTLNFGLRFPIRRKFVVGTGDLNKATLTDLQKEQNNYNDLLFLVDYKDSYKTLTAKLLKSLIWVSENIKAQFVMKVDDDSFVRLDILVKDLERRQHLGRLYWGFFRGDSKVKRVGPWAENNWFLSDHYLPYALGGGYILSFELVDYLSKISGMLQMYNSEDVSVGVWLAPIRLNRIHDVRFDTEYKSRGCNNTDIVSHKQKPEDMYEKHDLLTHHNKLCREEKEAIYAYEYNWQVLSSRCCQRTKRSLL